MKQKHKSPNKVCDLYRCSGPLQLHGIVEGFSEGKPATQQVKLVSVLSCNREDVHFVFERLGVVLGYGLPHRA